MAEVDKATTSHVSKIESHADAKSSAKSSSKSTTVKSEPKSVKKVVPEKPPQITKFTSTQKPAEITKTVVKFDQKVVGLETMKTMPTQMALILMETAGADEVFKEDGQWVRVKVAGNLLQKAHTKYKRKRTWSMVKNFFILFIFIILIAFIIYLLIEQMKRQ
ncbi:hypothetical protein EDEG_03068 [Edhazardia aedis USNM 41457]|uniref:Uncharacterized protein n=1 Tax=Edhazardia aedis (strain USNM 41457) TaxID=1003232 RepID=J9DMC5_EDHAE|nr:hypothetical protein EDEG_03068 [Edhazardia aedis USNM 41457]|eukprot:EJW02522.1 hypothetical protein EDEG_03068 [Edhazardia aedis USNM 41457]